LNSFVMILFSFAFKVTVHQKPGFLLERSAK
jgi:hypothetical protein